MIEPNESPYAKLWNNGQFEQVLQDAETLASTEGLPSELKIMASKIQDNLTSLKSYLTSKAASDVALGNFMKSRTLAPDALDEPIGIPEPEGWKHQYVTTTPGSSGQPKQP